MILLENLLNNPRNGNNDFSAIARDLMSNYLIRKEMDSETHFYYFTDIEFYYYGANHKDESVHPHFITKPSQFRVHYSGVDITLGGDWGGCELEIQNRLMNKKKYSNKNKTLEYNEIKDIITNDVKYGGILLRGLKEKGREFPIIGPWRVLCELFNFSGSNLSLNIVENKNEIVTFESGVRGNLGNNSGIFKTEEYRFKAKFQE